MTLKTLLSVLLVYRSNFHVLHWMAKGKNFFMIHSKAEEFVNKLSKDIDVVAEMLLRIDDSVVNYMEALKCIEEDETHEFILVDSDKLFDAEDFCKYSLGMMKGILECIEELLKTDVIMEPKNVGIKATLESMHNEYDLQYRYLLKRLDD